MNDVEKNRMIDFPTNPTPSMKAYEQFVEYIHEYLNLFVYHEGCLAIDSIKLGTLEHPRIIAPIEMEPNEIDHILRRSLHILEKAKDAAQQSIIWTKRIIVALNFTSSGAEKRIQNLTIIVEIIDKLLRRYRGAAWHPRCYEEIKNFVEDSFRHGDPRIPIEITIYV